MRFDGWNDELYHHGIKGQKWGIRRYQNPDGTLTEEGKARYNQALDNPTRKNANYLNKIISMPLAKSDYSLNRYADKLSKYAYLERRYTNKYSKKHGSVTTEDGKTYVLFPKKIEAKLAKLGAERMAEVINYSIYRDAAQNLLKDDRIANYKVDNIDLHISHNPYNSYYAYTPFSLRMKKS